MAYGLLWPGSWQNQKGETHLIGPFTQRTWTRRGWHFLSSSGRGRRLSEKNWAWKLLKSIIQIYESVSTSILKAYSNKYRLKNIFKEAIRIQTQRPTTLYSNTINILNVKLIYFVKIKYLWIFITTNAHFRQNICELFTKFPLQIMTLSQKRHTLLELPLQSGIIKLSVEKLHCRILAPPPLNT